jgi:hypothetical protein
MLTCRGGWVGGGGLEAEGGGGGLGLEDVGQLPASWPVLVTHSYCKAQGATDELPP